MKDLVPLAENSLPPDVKKAYIKEVVERLRERGGIKPIPGLKSEGSCFAARGGEWGNLLRVQLVHTTNGSGEWSILDDPAILDPFFDYVTSEYPIFPEDSHK